MKRFCILLVCLIAYTFTFSQVTVYRRPISYKVITTYSERPSKQIIQKSHVNDGWIDIKLHSDYNFNNAIRIAHNPMIEFGGSLTYYFKPVSDVNLGILIGYDNGLNQWWRYPADNGYFIYQSNYWDIRAGACLSKYFSVGVTAGEYFLDSHYKTDIGCFANINIPLCEHFGIFADGKWTKYQGFSIGGGFFINIYTK
ncbi:MAG: hypothetical protein [Wendovervirus sonii]|uniref:Uncharacterized protein n=1 Tax=phage Lak_Megaphage_Sonny TaxID=3109229 RepID=A0ABZ0Z396_9CAUD|nr:MAG: hypothetical protein [phage Lak_Megaphage_Sonny]